MAHVPSARAAEIARAEALVREVDALPGPEMVDRVGDDDVQAALETIADGSSGDRAASAIESDADDAAPDQSIGETPLGEAIDGGTGLADAA